jgi:octaprenyl-diphosphate synthase
MKDEMEVFEHRFAEALSGSVVPMDDVMRHVGAVNGKRLRPRLVFLSARLFGEVTEATWRTALFVELLHTATLIHDDVVDESSVRRDQASVNARWDNKTAVLAGDYLLSKAMMQLSNSEDHLILQEMLRATMAMSEGELLQSGKLIVDSVELYLDVITRKTAKLIQACCVCGAMSSHSSLSTPHSSLSTFSLFLGLVFQMRDDLLDADNPETITLAERLLPEYLDKALKALDALAPYAINKEALSSLRELTLFCATRNH